MMLRRLMISASTAPPSPGGGKRVLITIPAQVEALTDFPLYIDLADLPSGFWEGLAYEDGRDIRAKDHAGSDLPFDLVFCAAFNRRGYLFIRATLASSAATSLYLHFGDSAVDQFVGTTDPLGRNAVWSDYIRIYTPGFEAVDRSGNRSNLITGWPLVQSSLVSTQVMAWNRGAAANALEQGLAFDGTHYYVVGTNRIAKYTKTWALVAENVNPCGDVTAAGIAVDHCGDPEVVGTVLYVPVENYVDATTYSNMSIARFNTADLSFISATDVSAQAHEVASLAYNSTDGLLYCASYAQYSTLWKYDLDGTLAGTLTLPFELPRIQGVVFAYGYLWASLNDSRTLGGAKGLARIDLVNNSRQMLMDYSEAWNSGISQGLCRTPNGLLWMHQQSAEQANSRAFLIQPGDINHGVLLNSGNSSTYPVTSELPALTTWSMSATAIPTSASIATSSLLSYGPPTGTAVASRAGLTRRNGGNIGVWDSAGTWLEGDGTLANGVTTRASGAYNGTSGRKVLVDGGAVVSDATSAARPVGASQSLFMGKSNAANSELFNGRLAFMYLRGSYLSDAWLLAEHANVKSSATFYSIGPVTPA